jgi:hypothetical protein
MRATSHKLLIFFDLIFIIIIILNNIYYEAHFVFSSSLLLFHPSEFFNILLSVCFYLSVRKQLLLYIYILCYEKFEGGPLRLKFHTCPNTLRISVGIQYILSKLNCSHAIFISLRMCVKFVQIVGIV